MDVMRLLIIAAALAVLGGTADAQSLLGAPTTDDVRRDLTTPPAVRPSTRDPILDRTPAGSSSRRLESERRRVDLTPSPTRPLHSAPLRNPGRAARPF